LHCTALRAVPSSSAAGMCCTPTWHTRHTMCIPKPLRDRRIQVKSRTALILTLLTLSGPVLAQTLAPHAQPVPGLTPQANAWINQEAARESATDQISPDAAVQSVSRSGLNWGPLPAQNVAALVMRAGAQQMDADVRAMLSVAQARRVAALNSRPGAAQRPPATALTPVKIAHSPSLDAYLASLQLSYDSLEELSELEQLRLQMVMDRQIKFLQTLSNIEKKDADSDQAIISNNK
jgi:hypothetical protein